MEDAHSQPSLHLSIRAGNEMLARWSANYLFAFHQSVGLPTYCRYIDVTKLNPVCRLRPCRLLKTFAVNQNEFDLRLHFKDVQTDADIYAAWERAILRWPNLKLVLNAQGAPNSHFPARKKFGENCYLSSPFLFDHFRGFDRNILADIRRKVNSEIYWAHEVLFDSNAISLISSWMADKQFDSKNDIIEFLRFVKGNGFIWNSAPYAIESSRLFTPGATETQLLHLYTTILAHERLEDLDASFLLSDGKARFQNPGLAEQRAQQQLATWHYMLNDKGDRSSFSLCDEAYLFLLVIADIQLAKPSPVAARDKLLQLLEYMHHSLGQIRLTVVWLAWGIFSSPPGVIYYFRKVQEKGDHLREVLKNMAWDLMLVFQQRRHLTDVFDPQHFFKVPYILTCDKGVEWICGLDPIRAVVWFDGIIDPITFPINDTRRKLEAILGREIIERYFSTEMAQIRAKSHPLELEVASKIIVEIEERLFH